MRYFPYDCHHHHNTTTPHSHTQTAQSIGQPSATGRLCADRGSGRRDRPLTCGLSTTALMGVWGNSGYSTAAFNTQTDGVRRNRHRLMDGDRLMHSCCGEELTCANSLRCGFRFRRLCDVFPLHWLLLLSDLYLRLELLEDCGIWFLHFAFVSECDQHLLRSRSLNSNIAKLEPAVSARQQTTQATQPTQAGASR
jgi:hypothetical protein